jgi:hypothetical protein
MTVEHSNQTDCENGRGGRGWIGQPVFWLAVLASAILDGVWQGPLCAAIYFLSFVVSYALVSHLTGPAADQKPE